MEALPRLGIYFSTLGGIKEANQTRKILVGVLHSAAAWYLMGDTKKEGFGTDMYTKRELRHDSYIWYKWIYKSLITGESLRTPHKVLKVVWRISRYVARTCLFLPNIWHYKVSVYKVESSILVINYIH